MQAEDPPQSPADTSRILRTERVRSALKTTRRPTWNTYISRLDRDQYSVFSCWLLLTTSVGLFIVILLIFGKQFCMVVFFFLGTLVALFVLFVQPPEGVHRRQAVRDMLMGSSPVVPAATQTVSVHSPERAAVPVELTSPGSQQQHQIKEKPVTGLKMKDPPTHLGGPPLYQLRKASMMFEKYDAATHVPPPPSNTTEAPKETKRGFFRSLFSRIRKGHLQMNPYYSTLTDDATSNEECGEVTTQRTVTQRSADPQSISKRETPESTKKHIGFQEEPLPVELAEKHTGPVTPPGPSPKNRQRRSQSIRPQGEMDMSTGRTRVDRSTSVFATVAPGSSAPGLRPLKSGVKGSVTPKLGAPVRRQSSIVTSKRTVNFSGAVSPPIKKPSPQRYYRKGEDWRKVADSSVSMGNEGADPNMLIGASSKSSQSRPPKQKASRKRSSTTRTDSSSPDLRMGRNKTYVTCDSASGYRKVYHVWSQ